MWVPPTTEELQQLLPQFEVLELIGYGGMGAVYKARQLSLDRLVAIKLLPPDTLGNGNSDHVGRFRNEARLMARMNHPHIVTVHDFGETSGGHLYFIMEFVDGTDVSKMIMSQGRLSPEYALAITAHVCDALHYAHTHGVIHRDIKPGNVLINMDGEVKVADFGIANAGIAHLGGIAEGNVTLGTPGYIAPEALMMGIEVDRRADLYSVGVMLYNMLTGDLPQGEYELASKLIGCDVRYDEIIARALQADRHLRYQGAREIRWDLDDIIITPVVKEGDATSKGAIPKQLVHRSPVNMPTFKRPLASEYVPPVRKRNYTPLLVAVIVAVLAKVAYVWRNELQSMLSSVGNQLELIARPKKVPAPQQHRPATGENAHTNFDPSDGFTPPTDQKKSLENNGLGKVDFPPSPPTDPRLSQLEVQFQQTYDRDIVRAHEASVSDLDTKYVAALDRAVIKAGKSDEAIRLKEEKLRVQKKEPIPLTDFLNPVPASLKKLRATYADALAKIDHDSNLKARSCYDELDRQLDGLQKNLIEEQHTDDAQLVKAKRDQIAEKISRL